jgi:hypothetical protein
MAVLTPQSVTSAGITPAVVTPAGAGDKVPVGAKVRVENNSGGSMTVTVTTHQTVDGSLAVADRVITVPNTETRKFLAAELYRNPADGYVDILCSATTGVALELDY